MRNILSNEGSGHDWWHIHRVWKLAIRLANKEGAKVNLNVVQLAALLHDIADWKTHDGNDLIGPKKATKWLLKIGADQNTICRVAEIISTLSFRGTKEIKKMNTIEGMLVQDADRLDAMGAIGIARGFVFAGHKNLPIYDPRLKSKLNMSPEEYKNLNRRSYTQINHFYEKLLLLKGLMNTKSAKIIAESRHKFMLEYLDRFYKEWDGEL